MFRSSVLVVLVLSSEIGSYPLAQLCLHTFTFVTVTMLLGALLVPVLANRDSCTAAAQRYFGP